ncbi:hypothetical protein K3495_g5778 [Podosphaera aphanis]|nr:hypothetical protein K3495_g5778 [Podosphaera aphanis]
MHLITVLAAAASVTGVSGYWKGFNVQSTNGTGACKTQDDWLADFNAVKSFPGNFDSVRVFASSDCNTLANAIPAALASGIRILAGVWTVDEAHYDAEKSALMAAVQKYGFDWMVAVSVGSEVLYRGESPPSRLAEQIYDVRGMLSTLPGYTTNVQVGHVDTWTAWVDNRNINVIKACDFIGTDGYPYYQIGDANAAENGYQLFSYSTQRVRDAVSAAGSNAWVWVTESGWPTTGPTINQAVPGVTTAQTYWKTVACPTFNTGHTFWFSLQDFDPVISFGVLDGNGKLKYDISC